MSKTPEEIKHLEFIQNVITRHNSNSFMIKGWTITITAALFALAGTIKEPGISFVSIIPVLLFWYLDSFYLANERCYVSLYDCAVNNYSSKIKYNELTDKFRKQEKIEDKKLDENFYEIKSSLLSMNLKDFNIIKRNNICDTFWSKSIKPFYLILLCLSLFISVVLFIYKSSEINKPIDIKTNFKTDTLNIKSSIPQNTINNIYLNDSLVKLKK